MKNKCISLMLVVLLLLSGIDASIVPTFASNKVTLAQFKTLLGESYSTEFKVIDGQTKNPSITLNANLSVYNKYDLIVWGSPFGDTKYSKVTKSTEYRYLGYTNKGEKVTNAIFPDDDGDYESDPEKWNFIKVAGASGSWRMNEVLKNYMQTKIFNGTKTLTVKKIGEAYGKNQGEAGWVTEGSVRVMHVNRDDQVWYKTFAIAPIMPTIVASIVTSQIEYTIGKEQQEVSFDASVEGGIVSPSFMEGTVVKKIVGNIEGKKGEKPSSLTISVGKKLTYDRNNLKIGKNKVILKGNVLAYSLKDEAVQAVAQKEITINVLPPDGVYVVNNSEAVPDNVQFKGVDIPVGVNVDADVFGVAAKDVSYWKLYAMKDAQGSTLQEKRIDGQNLHVSGNFQFIIPKSDVVGDDFTQTFKTTARVFLKNGASFDASQYPQTIVWKLKPVTPTPTNPTPAGPPPTAILSMPLTVKATDWAGISGRESKSHAPKGIDSYNITTNQDDYEPKYDFDNDGNKFVVQGIGSYAWNTIGEKTVNLNVSDEYGSDSTKGIITVLPPSPDTVINVTGWQKENRLVTIDLKKSTSPRKFPLVPSLSKIRIEPVTVGLTNDDIKIKPTGDPNEINVVFKKAGDYKIFGHTENGSYSDDRDTIITINADLVPEIKPDLSTHFYRDPTDNLRIKVNVYALPTSFDSDILQEMTYYIAHDSDNDGDFKDESYSEVHKGTETSFEFYTNKIGKYMLKSVVKEEFGQPTIDEFVLPSDRKIATYETPFEVDNVNPSADFRIGAKPSADILFIANQGAPDNATINAWFNSNMKPKFGTRKFDYKYQIFRGDLMAGLKSYQFDDKTKNYVVYLHSGTMPELSDVLKFGTITSQIINRNATFYGVGNASNSASMQKVINSINGNGRLFDLSGGVSNFQSMADIITEWIPSDIFLNVGVSSTADINQIRSRWNAVAVPRLNNAKLDVKLTINEGMTKYYDIPYNNRTSLYINRINQSGVGTNTGSWINYSWVPGKFQISDNSAINGATGMATAASINDPQYVQYSWKGKNVYVASSSSGSTYYRAQVNGVYPDDVEHVSVWDLRFDSTPYLPMQSVTLRDGSVYVIRSNTLWGKDTGGVPYWSNVNPTNTDSLFKVNLLNGKNIFRTYGNFAISRDGSIYGAKLNTKLIAEERVDRGNYIYQYLNTVTPELLVKSPGNIIDAYPWRGCSGMPYQQFWDTYTYGERSFLLLKDTGSLVIAAPYKNEYVIASNVKKVSLNRTCLDANTSNNWEAYGYYLTNSGDVYYIDGRSGSSSRKVSGYTAQPVLSSDMPYKIPTLSNIVDITAVGSDGIVAVREDGKMFAAGSIMNVGSVNYAVTGTGKSEPDMVYVPDYNLMHQNNKSLRDIYSKAKYRPQASKYFLNFADGNLAELDATLGAKMSGEDVRYLGLAKPSDQTQVNDFLINSGVKGSFVDNSNVDAAINQAVDYIINNTRRNADRTEMLVLKDEPLIFTEIGEDYESDNLINSRWKFEHTNPNYFMNPLGTESGIGGYQSSPVISFSKVGLFKGWYQVQDDPTGDARFANYNKWTLDNPTDIKVHRLPEAYFDATCDINGNVSITDASYDPDRQYEATKGIVFWKWQYKEVGASEWVEGQVPNKIDPAKYYVQQLFVKDKEGAWSAPFAQIIGYIPLDMKLTLDPNVIPASEKTTATVVINTFLDITGVNGWLDGHYRVPMQKVSETVGSSTWKVDYTVPATTPDKNYLFFAKANLGNAVSARLDVVTPINLVPILPAEGDVGESIDVNATTSKYADAVTVKAFKGTSYERSVTLTGAQNGLKKNWTKAFVIPEVPGGNYAFEYTATTPNGNVEVKTVILSIKDISMANFRVNMILDKGLEGYYLNSGGKPKYVNRPIDVNGMAINDSNFINAGIPVVSGFDGLKRGYFYKFAIDTKGLNGANDTVQIMPRFFAYYPGAPGVRSSECDLYWIDSNNKVWKAGEGAHSDLRYLVLSSSDRSIRTSTEATWASKYLIPGTSFLVPKGTSQAAAAEMFKNKTYIKGDIIVNFYIVGYKNGVAKYDYNNQAWPKERTISKWPFSIGDVIVYDYKKSNLDDIVPNRVK